MNLEQVFSMCFSSKIDFQYELVNGTPRVEYESRAAELRDRPFCGALGILKAQPKNLSSGGQTSNR